MSPTRPNGDAPPPEASDTLEVPIDVELGDGEGVRLRRRALTIGLLLAFFAAAVLGLGPLLVNLAVGGTLALALALSRLGVLGGDVFGLVLATAAVLFALILAAQLLAFGLRFVARLRARRAGRTPVVVRWPMGLVVLAWVGFAASAALVGSISPVLGAAVFLAAGTYLALWGPLVVARAAVVPAWRAAGWASRTRLRTGGMAVLAAGGLAVTGWQAWRRPPMAPVTDGALAWALAPAAAATAPGLRAALQRTAMLGETVLADPTRHGAPLGARLAAAELPSPMPSRDPAVDAPRSSLEMAVAVGRIRHDRFEACAAALRTAGSDVYEGARLWLTRDPARIATADDVLFESLLRVCLRDSDGALDDPRAVFLEAVANTDEDRRQADDAFPRCEAVRMPGACWRDVGPADLRRPSERALVRWAWCRIPAPARRILSMRLRDGRALVDAALRTGRDPADAAALYYQGLDVLRTRWRQCACGEAQAAAP